MKGTSLLWIVGVLAGILILLLLSSPSPEDIRIRLEREGAAPFDAEVLYEALPGWLGAEVTPVGDPAFVTLADTTLTNTTYLFLTRHFEPGEDEADRLLAFLERGNTVFVAAHGMTGPFFERLGTPDTTDEDLGTGWVYDVFMNGSLGVEDSLQLVAPGVSGSFGFPVEVNFAELYGLDPETSEVLGVDGDGDYVTLARIRVGEGTLLLSSTPLAFSNAALVGEGDAEAYVSAALAALPSQPLLWDDYKKPYREQARTPLRYVLTSPGLRGGYFLLLTMGLLYLLFRGRRWQRAIPVVTPPPNAQREFARTVGRLHLTHGDSVRLAQRTVHLFLDRLRSRLRMVEPDLTDDTAQRAARRAGVPEDEALALFAHLHRVQADPRPTAQDLVDLDTRLDRFFRHVDASAQTLAEAD
ncbi:MAG: DUF4350 domain-containing protein [Bacteroidota bacterium]